MVLVCIGLFWLDLVKRRGDGLVWSDLVKRRGDDLVWSDLVKRRGGGDISKHGKFSLPFPLRLTIYIYTCTMYIYVYKIYTSDHLQKVKYTNIHCIPKAKKKERETCVHEFMHVSQNLIHIKFLHTIGSMAWKIITGTSQP